MEHITNELLRNINVFKGLLEDISPEVYQWKQDPSKWCLLEIVCHLHDEEREDFRARVRYILESPDLPLTSINPTGWVTERNYMGQDYKNVLDNFLNERNKSVQWLRSLENPAWGNIYEHPILGELTAKMILVNWLAHDYLHIRQIIKLKYDYLRKTSAEDLSYAGNW
jgi:hypothetical protein